MKKLEAIVKPYKFEEVRVALSEMGISGMSVTNVMGFGRQRGHTELYRGSEYSAGFLPKIKIEIFVEESLLAKAIHTICVNAQTGKIGDGKIFVYETEDALRVRTGETGEKAIS